MSAYIVAKPTIDALIGFARHTAAGDSIIYLFDPAGNSGDRFYLFDRSDLDRLGRILWTENARSVAYRYGEEPAGEVEGYSYDRAGEQWAARLDQVDRTKLCATVLKLAACLEYQSCEHPEWHDSDARQILEAIKARAVRFLPHYDAAPCGLDEWAANVRTGPISLLSLAEDARRQP